MNRLYATLENYVAFVQHLTIALPNYRCLVSIFIAGSLFTVVSANANPAHSFVGAHSSTHALTMHVKDYAFTALPLLDDDDFENKDNNHIEHKFYALRRDSVFESLFKQRLTGLEKATHDALNLTTNRIVYLEYHDQFFVAKRIRPKSRSWLKQTLVSALCSRAFPGHMHAVKLAPADGLFEAKRIQLLRKAGMKVPKVALIQEYAVVFSHCGRDLRSYLGSLDYDGRIALLRKAAADLAQFHLSGHWHGGAQLRNWLINEDGHFYRVDFEESLGSALSLPLAQIYDVCQFLGDATRYAKTSQQAGTLVSELLTIYKANYWSEVHQQLLDRTIHLLAPAQRILNLFDNWHMRDIMRLKWLLKGLL